MSLAKVLTFSNAENGSSIRARPTVLVISPAGFKDNLKDALLAENKQKYSDKLQFIFCEHVEEVLGLTQLNTLSADYIVIVIDPRESTCVQMAEDNISKIDSLYVEAGRLCFVNGASSIPPADTGIPLGSINVVSQKYSTILINGDILKPEKCLVLASRIVRLASVVIGLDSGVPMSVDIPGYLPFEFT